MLRPLRTGAAYHGNRMPHHVEKDMRDMAVHNMNLVVHMFSHTDWDRHKEKMKDIIYISQEAGLEVWVDNWGLGGPPGDISHFLAYYPDSHVYYSNGDMDPTRACLNSPDFLKFIKEWIDTVGYIGGKTIFWDEPRLPVKTVGDKTYYGCTCQRCRKIFEEKYNRPMPETMDADVNEFIADTIYNYVSAITSYAETKAMENVLWVMLDPHDGISMESIEKLCRLPSLQNIGSDTYWLGKSNDPYGFVYEGTKFNLDVCDRCQKDHNIWIQAYRNPKGSENDIILATEAAYDAGARTILAWGYYGSDSNDYAAKNPELAWIKTCEAMRRIWDMEHDRLLAENRARVIK